MKLRYYATFKSLEEKTYRFEIYTQTATRADELTLSAAPMSVEYESDGLFSPLKLSNAVIEVLTGKVLTDLYTGENHGVQARLYNKSENVLEWFGYLTPNLYSGDYITDFDSLNLEAVDTLASLENIKYSYIGDSGTFRPIQEIVTHLLDKADAGRIIPKLYVQKTHRLTKDSTSCLLSDIHIQERNFFDEANEPITCREVLEHIAKYLGLSVIQWRDAYYMIDYDFINRGKTDFFVYDRAAGTIASTTIASPVRTVNEVGITSGSASISLGDVFNKVSVMANLNTIKNVVPELLEDEDFTNQNADVDKFYTSTIDSSTQERQFIVFAFLRNKKWETLTPVNSSGTGLTEITKDNYGSIVNGAWFSRADEYEGSKPSSISWDNILTLYRNNTKYGYETPYLKLSNSDTQVYEGGYFIVNISFKISKHHLPHSNFKTSDDKFDRPIQHRNHPSADVYFPCRLAIGNHYYNGTKWEDYADYQTRVSRGYYKDVVYVIEEYTAWNIRPADQNRIYWHKDTYGYKKFINRAAYDSLPAATEKGTQLSGGTQEYIYYFIQGGEKIYIDEAYYYECLLRDKFALVHETKNGESIFDSEMQLTNKVSYEMNLSESSDGVPVKLPANMILSGKLGFELFAPNLLGRKPPESLETCNAFHISEMSLVYSAVNASKNKLGLSDDDSDIVYSNTISDDNVTESDDVELYINTNARNIAAYSNTATKTGTNYAYLKTVYNPLEDTDMLPEQILIDKLYRHYKSPKFRYSNELKNSLSILSRVKENSLNKTMVVDSMNIDYANESCHVQLIEV